MRSLYFLALFATISVACSAQTAEQILQKYFEAIGGQQNLRNITASSGEAFTIQHYPRLDTTISRNISKAPFSFNYKTYKKDELQFEVFGNGEGITHYLYKPFPMKVEREKQKVEISVAHSVLNGLENQKFKRLADTTINNNPAFAIKFNGSKKYASIGRTYYFDKNTYILVGVSSDGLNGDLTFFEEYKTIGNLLMPMRMRYQLNGTLINETEVKNLDINPTLPDSLFAPREYIAPAKTKFRLNNKIEFLNAELGDLSFDEFVKTFNGKPILIDLWASWCGPCKYEFAKYDDAYFHFLKSKNIQPVYISVDKPEKEKDWKKVIDQFVLNGMHVRAGKKLTHSIQKQFYSGEGMYIPRLILIGKDGNVLSAELPKLSSGVFYTTVNELIK